MPGRKYSDELLAQAAAMREAGQSYAYISERLGMSVGSVAWHCLRLGADRPDAKPIPAQWSGPAVMQRSGHVVRRFTADEDAVIQKMALAGEKVADISRRLARPPNSVLGRLMTLARHEARAEDFECMSN